MWKAVMQCLFFFFYYAWMALIERTPAVLSPTNKYSAEHTVRLGILGSSRLNAKTDQLQHVAKMLDHGFPARHFLMKTFTVDAAEFQRTGNGKLPESC